MAKILLLAAGFLVLVAISAMSVFLVNRAREDNALVVHTSKSKIRFQHLLLEIRRAESAARGYLADLRAATSLRSTKPPPQPSFPTLTKLATLVGDNPVQTRKPQKTAPAGRSPAQANSRGRWISSSATTLPARIALLREAGASNIVLRINDVANAMRAEEDRLFAPRTATADRTSNGSPL